MLLASLVTDVAEQAITLSLIFGGCCSNALTLEVITSQHPPAGSLLTLVQFSAVALASLWKQLVLVPRPMARKAILKHIVRLARRTEAQTILLDGPDRDASQAFMRDLAEESAGMADVKELKLLLQPPSDHARKAATMRIALVKGDILEVDSDIVVDIVNTEYPRLLRPSLERYTLNPFRYRLKTRHIPLARYAFQVLLFLLISLLNNAAFAYHVPMAVHIIFRSGGLVVNMLLGWLLKKRRYTKLQVHSVLLVTFGVAVTTLSSMQSKPRHGQGMTAQSAVPDINYGRYAIGIGMLSAALVLSGILGLDQDHVFERYGRGHWEESMFYLHALSLPLFAFTASDIRAQMRVVTAGPRIEFSPFSLNARNASAAGELGPLPYLPVRLPTLRVPAFYVPLAANVFTQLFCVTGVNRLTARANSLTVALVLVVRKAVSLAVSVLLFGGGRGSTMLWAGAASVLLGTIGYTIGSKGTKEKKE